MKGIKIILIITIILSMVKHVNALDNVLVIDTGLPKFVNTKKLCKSGHKNFTDDDSYDVDGHSSNIIGLISKANGKYCVVSYKAFDKSESLSEYNTAIVSASFQKFKIVNLSIAGNGFNIMEKNAIARMLKNGTHVVVAAGNSAISLDSECNVYPACYKKAFKKYKNFHVIGAKDLWQSNKGKIITNWELGKNQGNPSLSGTSQATANYTKKLIELILK